MKCQKCNNEIDDKTLLGQKYICEYCGKYLRIPAYDRIKMVTDKGTFEEWYGDIVSINTLNTESYDEKLSDAKEKTGLKEAVVVGRAKIYGENVCIGVCDTRFLMGSMGKAVGEKITCAVERATKEKLPIFIFCASGGARMQEGIISLMQMEKTAAALGRHADKGLFYCPILTDPTTGGVTASFAMLGDVILAEPGALIGFAGQRVIKQTIGKELPEGFQTAEFQEEHGMIDGIVERKRLKKIMQFLVLTNKKQNHYANFNDKCDKKKIFPLSINKIKSKFAAQKTPWEKVKHVRNVKHPGNIAFIDELFEVFIELKGDRRYANDKAIVGGIAMFHGQPVTVIAEDRGKDFQDCVEKNFGMPNPEGYRKALRLMEQAEKFSRPIISFISTAGAYCGVEAEERGIGEAIATNLLRMSKLKVPVLAIIVGEAGSGGALATAVGNEVWMFENATYGVLSPEGYASILWKDSKRAEEAAEKMHITADDLKELGIIDKIIPEYGGAKKENVREISQYLTKEIVEFLKKYSKMTVEEIVDDRYNRFRRM